jgi:hypothetical protein
VKIGMIGGCCCCGACSKELLQWPTVLVALYSITPTANRQQSSARWARTSHKEETGHQHH